ncbi:MAG: DNA-3-methyladenine glycosylase 2 family protein [Caldilineaceae bacterium]|nr:DNA-3-methyladenine glycosylase 2 family protein [Caldilineaceae bacterium]
MNPITLDETMLAQGVAELIARDADLAAIHARLGLPPLWPREPGFPTLVHIILEQQVSIASALATFDKLRALVDPLTPDGVLTLDDETLRGIGFSRQKTAYVRHLANAIISGSLDVNALETLPDEQVRGQLVALKGIGPWSAEVYLLMALRRADAWPAGDLALVVAAQTIKGLPQRPDTATLIEIAEAWRPWRAVAARLLWHHYLNKPT